MFFFSFIPLKLVCLLINKKKKKACFRRFLSYVFLKLGRKYISFIVARRGVLFDVNWFGENRVPIREETRNKTTLSPRRSNVSLPSFLRLTNRSREDRRRLSYRSLASVSLNCPSVGPIQIDSPLVGHQFSHPLPSAVRTVN